MYFEVVLAHLPPHKGLLLKERIFSPMGSKFLPLKVTPNLK